MIYIIKNMLFNRPSGELRRFIAPRNLNKNIDKIR